MRPGAPKATVWMLTAAVLLPAASFVQDAGPDGPASGATASVSADSVELAEVFELRITLPVPPGSVVYFPDTLPRTPDIESFAPVEWDAERGPDNGATLTLTYPMIPFASGLVTVPPVDVVTVEADDDADGERIPGGSRVGVWDDAPRSFRDTRRVTGAAVRVAPVHTAEDIVAGLSPRPPADVIGPSWSWPLIGLILFFASVLGGVVVTTTRDWLARRPTGNGEPTARATTPGDARQHALAEIDRLIAAAPHPAERALETYTASSDVVRDYASSLHPNWSKDLTSTELMARLDAEDRSTTALAGEMQTAEEVKFGGRRPAAEATDEHLRTLRAWLADRGTGAPS